MPAGLSASPERVILDRLRARVDLWRSDLEPIKLSREEAQTVLRLAAPAVEADEARRMHAPNGASFFTTLEGYLVAAHDKGVINENALLVTLRELLGGQVLTLSMLSAIFGVQPIYELTTPEIAQVERLARRLTELLTPHLVAAVTPIRGEQS